MSSKANQTTLSTIIWSSNYRGLPNQDVVFGPDEEHIVVKDILHWMLQSSSGFDLDMVRDILANENKQNDFETIDDDDEKAYIDQLIEYLTPKCNSIKNLKKICAKYGDSYFEDKEGWKLIIIK
jgi:hypothetical protein